MKYDPSQTKAAGDWGLDQINSAYNDIISTYASPNKYYNPSQRRNLVPTTKAMPGKIKYGIHRSSSTSKRRLSGRRATQRNVLSNISQGLCPVVHLEEHFTAPQFIPDATTVAGAGTTGAFAPPMAQGEIGSIMHQLVSPTTYDSGVYDATIAYPLANSGVNAQCVQWQGQYLRKEQDILLAALNKGKVNQLDSSVLAANLTTAGLLASQGNANKDFIYRGGTCIHTFINTGNTQCYFSLLEFQPRRFGNITPQECWDYDLRLDHVGMLNPSYAPSNLAAGIVQAHREATALNSLPGRNKNGMFNYWFKQLSHKKFHMEPGEELKYKQIFPPWIDKGKMRDIYLSRFDDNTTYSIYNTRSRYLLFVCHGESNKFTGTSATTTVGGVTTTNSVDLNRIGVFNGSWSIGHNQKRFSSYQTMLPTRYYQKAIVDTPDTFGGTAPVLEQDVNEPNDVQQSIFI